MGLGEFFVFVLGFLWVLVRAFRVWPGPFVGLSWAFCFCPGLFVGLGKHL